MGAIGLGTSFTTDCKRVPNPPANMIASLSNVNYGFGNKAISTNSHIVCPKII